MLEASPHHWLLGKSKWLLKNHLKKQAALGTVTFLIYLFIFCFLLREVENMIEAERPLVSTVLVLFCVQGQGEEEHDTQGYLQQETICSYMTARLSQILIFFLIKILLLTLALYTLLSELDSDQNVFADLKSGPGIKKLDAKHCLCLHQWRLPIYRGRPSSLP